MHANVLLLQRFLSGYMIICYVLFLGSRLRGVARRGKQPLLRGPAWFLDLPVQPGFYEGPGRAILRAYRRRVWAPFLLDIPVLLFVAFTRHYMLLGWLVVALVPLIHINHLMNVARSRLRARPFALEQDSQPVASLGLSLTPRRLRDHSNAALEWLMAIALTLAFVVLLHVYKSQPGEYPFWRIFWVPAFYAYLQFGLLLVKQVIVGWRAPIAMQQTAEYLQAQEVLRSYYLRTCDWGRAFLTASICFWPFILSLPKARVVPVTGVWLLLLLVTTIVSTLWLEVLRKRTLVASLRVQPMRLPDLMAGENVVTGLFCYRPPVPTLLLKGQRGYSLNLANPVSYVSAIYLTGMVALVSAARWMH